MEDNKKEPNTSEAKGSNKDTLKIQKKLENIVANIEKTEDLPRNITEQLVYTSDYILSQKSVFNGYNILIDKKWIVIDNNMLDNFLIDTAINLGIDKFKVLRKGTITRLRNEFLSASKRIFNKKYADKFEMPKEKEIPPTQNPIIMAHSYIRKNYPKTTFNLITERIDFGVKDKTTDDVITDMRMKGIRISLSEFETYLRSDKVKKTDEFKEYFESDEIKKGWTEGDTDYIEMLSESVITDSPSFWHSMFKKHLVRAVKQARGNSEFANRFVIVLRSTDESIGKSTFLRFLNPFGSEFYIENIDSDISLAMTKTFVFNFEEIESLNKIGFSKLKSFISAESCNIRRLYTQNFFSKPRRCSFWASTNDLEFLGGGQNTRWLIVSVKSIDFGYSKEIDIDKVWAQATYLLNNGFDYKLTKQECEVAKSLTKEHRFKSNEEEYISEYLQPSTKHFATPTTIEHFLNRILGQTKVKAQRIGSALKDMGYERVKNNGVYGYEIELKNGNDINDNFIFSPESEEPF
jgi:hypothetical protein